MHFTSFFVILFFPFFFFFFFFFYFFIHFFFFFFFFFFYIVRLLSHLSFCFRFLPLLLSIFFSSSSLPSFTSYSNILLLPFPSVSFTLYPPSSSSSSSSIKQTFYIHFILTFPTHLFLPTLPSFSFSHFSSCIFSIPLLTIKPRLANLFSLCLHLPCHFFLHICRHVLDKFHYLSST
ncbi:unnamed protein product [Acanthosepion pharaonis]|uniref:Uncharacterized protein n=1 Tax=Acanthosepion pharaonis TaxID=158019 RepID=A0A812DII5_ACAPH|nr:unnamed protein product [Sepia pharaonis]